MFFFLVIQIFSIKYWYYFMAWSLLHRLSVLWKGNTLLWKSSSHTVSWFCSVFIMWNNKSDMDTRSSILHSHEDLFSVETIHPVKAFCNFKWQFFWNSAPGQCTQPLQCFQSPKLKAFSSLTWFYSLFLHSNGFLLSKIPLPLLWFVLFLVIIYP